MAPCKLNGPFMPAGILTTLAMVLLYLTGCATTLPLTVADVVDIRNSADEGLLLVSLGRVERPLPYYPVVYYHVLSHNRQRNELNVVANLKSEVIDLRYPNGSHFFGTGKESVVVLARIPAGSYWLSGYRRQSFGYIPEITSSGELVPTTRSADVRIFYRIEIAPGKLTYGGELIINSYFLASNDSVTVSDELERDLEFMLRDKPQLRSLEVRKSIATAQ